MTIERPLLLVFDTLHRYWRCSFDAMASPAEILIDSEDERLAREICVIVAREAWRVEQKFSRYRDDNVVHAINHQPGFIQVDEETALLLDFANQCFELSEGAFDITSGVLQAVWRFGGEIKYPAQDDIEKLKVLIGWDKVVWENPRVRLQPGMRIDFGGLGKEYAVDQAALQLTDHNIPVLINFGGDIVSTATRRSGVGWEVGIEGIAKTGNQAARVNPVTLELTTGAIATSGDTHRFIEIAGKRYGHILDPRTGWPVVNAPRTVTVMADNCTEAGMLATMAMLQGDAAEEFLRQQSVRFWCSR